MNKIKNIFVKSIPIIVNVILLICLIMSSSVREFIGFIFMAVLANSIFSKVTFRD